MRLDLQYAVEWGGKYPHRMTHKLWVIIYDPYRQFRHDFMIFSEREFDKDRSKEKVESSAESDEDEGEET